MPEIPQEMTPQAENALDMLNLPSTPTVSGLPKRSGRLLELRGPLPAQAGARVEPGRVDAALEHAKICARIGDDNRGKEILLLDLRATTPLIDFFVIISAVSRRQASSIAYEIDAEMKKLGETKLGIEGAEEGRWTLIDYGDFVVHVFSEEARTYYDLEGIWGDSVRLDWQDPRRAKPRLTDASDK